MPTPVSSGTEPRSAPKEGSRPPRGRPIRSFLRLAADVLTHGGPGYLQFAVTSACNAACAFCGFAAGRTNPSQRRSVTLAQARDAIDICARNHIGYLTFVGGEPLLHPDLPEMVRHCAGSGIRPMICTHGGLWTDGNMRAFAEAGLSGVIMSVDAPEVSLHERNRGLPGLCRTIRRANEVFSDLGIQTTASITVSRLIDDYHRLPDFLASLGFASVTFSYPLTFLGSSYMGFSDSGLVTFEPDELAAIFETIKQLKGRGGIRIVNPRASLTDLQRQLRKEPARFPCLAGHKYFFLDWNLDLYRCHAWDSPMGTIHEFDRSKTVRDGCTRCLIDCYRDPSVLQFIAVNLSDAREALARGRLKTFAGRLLDPRNVTSLKAVLEELPWIRNL
jgi:MoaA/NifB/PqqE/SkfB family radical SAM enzyme